MDQRCPRQSQLIHCYWHHRQQVRSWSKGSQQRVRGKPRTKIKWVLSRNLCLWYSIFENCFRKAGRMYLSSDTEIYKISKEKNLEFSRTNLDLNRVNKADDSNCSCWLWSSVFMISESIIFWKIFLSLPVILASFSESNTNKFLSVFIFSYWFNIMRFGKIDALKMKSSSNNDI